jgi:hypothetical protein
MTDELQRHKWSRMQWSGAGTMAITPKETKNADKVPRPAQPEFENRQLNLFQNFLCNNETERDHLSNAIDLWDNVPRYSISRKAMDEARIDGLFLKKHQTEFQYKRRPFIRTLTPALVQDLDGVDRYYYASANEELIEDALRKIATDQQSGYFDKPNYRSGVVFTLYMLRQELKRRGHTRSYQEIVLGLNIMSGSVVEIAERDEQGREQILIRSTYLPLLAAVSRGRLREDPKAKWIVQFHPLVTASIDQVTYRQFNYHLMMSHSTQLARWLHKQLALKYTFASLADSFEMRYSTVKRDSGLLENYTRSRAAIDALHQALTELQEHNVLLGFTRANITGVRGKLLDAVFTLTASMDFIRDTKAGSRRLALATHNGEQKSVGLTGGSLQSR